MAPVRIGAETVGSMRAAVTPNLRFCHFPPSPSLAPHLGVRPSLHRSFASLRSVRSIASSSSSSSSSMAAASTPSSAESPGPFSVLFVCLGNICRSPAAEAVFRDIVRKRGLEARFRIDSAGTIGYHKGDPADSRMKMASRSRGVEVTSISRPICPSDFREFDLILAMDMQNRDDLMSAFERWRFKEPLPEDAPKKVKLMCSYCKKHKETEVPDPYYGGQQGFEKVLNLLEDACEAMLDSILAENSHISDS